MKKPPKPVVAEDELSEFHDRPFECPHCAEITAVLTTMDKVPRKRATCSHCGKDFLIVNDKPQKLPN
jgi:transcription elongation factor Elf1